MKIPVYCILCFIGGILAHMSFSVMHLSSPNDSTTDFNFRLKSEFLNERNQICAFLKEHGCGCNLIIETEQKCQIELEDYIMTQIEADQTDRKSP